MKIEITTINMGYQVKIIEPQSKVDDYHKTNKITISPVLPDVYQAICWTLRWVNIIGA